MSELDWVVNFDSTGLSISNTAKHYTVRNIPFDLDGNISYVLENGNLYHYNQDGNIYKTNIDDHNTQVYFKVYDLTGMVPYGNLYIENHNLYFRYSIIEGALLSKQEFLIQIHDDGSFSELNPFLINFPALTLVFSDNIMPSVNNLKIKVTNEDDFKFVDENMFFSMDHGCYMLSNELYLLGNRALTLPEQLFLYKINPETKEVKQLHAEPVKRFTLVGEMIYFIGQDDVCYAYNPLDGSLNNVNYSQGVICNIFNENGFLLCEISPSGSFPYQQILFDKDLHLIAFTKDRKISAKHEFVYYLGNGV